MSMCASGTRKNGVIGTIHLVRSDLARRGPSTQARKFPLLFRMISGGEEWKAFSVIGDCMAAE
jgi:hypothetical protein